MRWGGSPEIAISIGGFHPHYTPPALLGGLRRVAVDMSPAIAVTLHAEGYLAITSNTVQFGVQVRLIADIGVASGEAWIGLDALFRWAPTFHFEVDISAGIALKVAGHTFAGVDFAGHLQGVTPWSIEGHGDARRLVSADGALRRRAIHLGLDQPGNARARSRPC